MMINCNGMQQKIAMCPIPILHEGFSQQQLQLQSSSEACKALLEATAHRVMYKGAWHVRLGERIPPKNIACLIIRYLQRVVLEMSSPQKLR